MLNDGTTVPARQATEPDTRQTPERPMPERPLLGFTAAEAAAILNVHRNTIYDWIKGDEPLLVARKVGKSHYIRRESLYALLDADALGVAS